jgi:hypothetical protein
MVLYTLIFNLFRHDMETKTKVLFTSMFTILDMIHNRFMASYTLIFNVLNTTREKIIHFDVYFFRYNSAAKSIIL